MKMVAGGAWAHNMSACTVFHQKTERIERPVLHPLKHCLPIISGLIYVTTTKKKVLDTGYLSLPNLETQMWGEARLQDNTLL